MQISPDLQRALAAASDRSSEPLRLMWPTSGSPAGWMSFVTPAEWQGFVVGLGLTRRAPDIVARKFERAQKLCLLAWLDFELMIAAELTAFTALELALRDRYGDKVKDRKGNIIFHRLLFDTLVVCFLVIFHYFMNYFLIVTICCQVIIFKELQVKQIHIFRIFFLPG